MAQNIANGKAPLASWHRNLLITGAVFSVLLIAMGASCASPNPSATAPIGRDVSAHFFPLHSLVQSSSTPIEPWRRSQVC